MATSKIQVTEGAGKNVATYSLGEDAVTKEIGRVVLNSSAGVEISTLPISGTVTANQGGAWTVTISGTVSITANSSINLAQVAGTTADTNSGVKSAGTLRVVLATDQPSLTNKLLVTPDSVALPANQSVNVNQLAGTTPDTNSGNKSAGTLRTVLATDQPQLTNALKVDGSAVNQPVLGFQATLSTDITRPNDTTTYTANDAWADSTSAPTTGGFTLTGAARASGGSGIITDIYICSSAVPALLLQAELHIFDQAVTAVNDNAAWNLSDSDAKLRLAVIPFTLLADANNSYVHLTGLNIGFTCVGTANLRYLVKVKNAYIPVALEVLTVRAKTIQNT